MKRSATTAPEVSVIIPAYNSERYIGEAIQSVLNQTLPPTEILVIDDDSEEKDAEIAETFGESVKVFRRSHAGIGASRNCGVSEARGEWIAFLDSDDLWMPYKLEEQVALLQRDPTLDGCLGLVQQFYMPGLEVSREAKKSLEERIEPGYLVGTMLVKRASFLTVGWFEEERLLGDFIDWMARARDAGLKLPVLDRLVMRRRIHGRNTVIRELSAQSDYARTLKIILDRRRRSKSLAGEKERDKS